MAYLVHKYLKPNLPLRKALVGFFGIGFFRSNQICDSLGFFKKIRVKDLAPIDYNALTRILTKTFFTESELNRVVNADIKRLVSIGSYRGFRHVLKLPVRGQRSRTNSRTCRKLKKK